MVNASRRGDSFSRYAGLLATGVALGGLIAGRKRWLKRRRLDFAERVVLLTGGSRGLGLIMARMLAAEGAHLALCARSKDELIRAQAELETLGSGTVTTYVCDVADSAQVEAMVDDILGEHGRIDVLINNAGIIQVGPVEVMTVNDFKAAHDIIYWGTVYASLAVLPYMKKSRQGTIVNITSINAALTAPHLLPYTAAKFAARGFSEGLGVELARHGIRVVTVLPGLMRTGSFVNALFKGDKAEFTWFSLGASLPLISMDAERAARRILRACRYGEARVVVGAPAKLGVLAASIFPRVTMRLLRLVDRVLPRPNYESSRPPVSGRLLRPKVAVGAFTALGDQAAQKFNEA